MRTVALLALLLTAAGCAATDSNENTRAPRNRIDRQPDLGYGDTSSISSSMTETHTHRGK